MNFLNKIKSYFFPIILIASVISGGLFGIFFQPYASYLKPLGDIFLNLIFTAIVPLIFFSVSSAIARVESVAKIGKIFLFMMLVFLLTGLFAAISTLIALQWFPLGSGSTIALAFPEKMVNVDFSSKIAGIFTAPNFSLILSHQNILALIVFSILVGFAVLTSAEKGKRWLPFLEAGEEIFMRVFSFIMYYAPIGFFAYFAVLVSQLGSDILKNYARVAAFYYIFSITYFITIYTFYAYLAGKKMGVTLFWRNVFLPMITALATCSSAASLPANLLAAKKMKVPAEVYETVIPLGTMIHKEGSIIGGMLKIVFIFGVFHLPFSSLPVLSIAIAISVLVGTVMGAIPSGGMLGELLILSVYGFPSSALGIIAAISIIIDPMATMLNVTGNTVSSMLVARFLNKPNLK